MAFAPRILLSPPEVSLADREALLRAFDSNWISTAGPAIAEFEAAMAAFVGRPAVAVASGTAGLHLALRLAGIAPGDVVLCQSFTFAASANPILYEKAIPWFLDSERRTWNVDPNAVEDALKELERTGRQAKALIAVHLYGMPAEIHAIRGLCERYGVKLIEDAAESLGSTVTEHAHAHRARQTGGLGFAGVFSFNGNKIITTAGGGMVTAASAADAARLRKWSTQSREPAVHYEHAELGFNYRMSNLLAALGASQLAGLPAKIRRRREIFEHYRKAFSSFPGLEFQPEPEGSVSNRWLSAIRLNPEVWGPVRDELMAHLALHGIESRPLWKPMHLQPLFRGARYFGSAVSQALFEEGLCLPSGSALTPAELEKVSGAVAEFLRAETRSPGAITPAALRADRVIRTEIHPTV